MIIFDELLYIDCTNSLMQPVTADETVRRWSIFVANYVVVLLIDTWCCCCIYYA